MTYTYKNMQRWIIGTCLLCFYCSSFSQGTTASPGEKIYEANYWISGSIALLGAAASNIARGRLRDKPGIGEIHVNRITAKGVNRFDRWALRQDPFSKEKAQKVSDRILYASAALPILLFLDKDIRQNWLDISLMYAETQAINSNMYGWSPLGPNFVERYRPAVYYEELPLKERNFGNLRNSFYSGHTSSTATGAFFAAKVFSDYHPNLGGKKYLLFGLAVLPPAIVGIYRIRALKHFPSDVIVGAAIGASIGILIPELHRLAMNRASFSAIYSEEVKGLGMIYRF